MEMTGNVMVLELYLNIFKNKLNSDSDLIYDYFTLKVD